MSSHILAEVDLLATRIGIVHRGRLIEELDSEALEHHRDRRLEIGARDLDRAAVGAHEQPASPRSGGRRRNGPLLELRDPRALEAPDEIARLLVAAGVAVTHLALARESRSRTTSCADVGRSRWRSGRHRRWRHERPSCGDLGGAAQEPALAHPVGGRRGILDGATRRRACSCSSSRTPTELGSSGCWARRRSCTAGTADWPTYLNMVGQAVAVGGGILFAFLTAWLFGREFADRTIRGLLATPTARASIVVAKLVRARAVVGGDHCVGAGAGARDRARRRHPGWLRVGRRARGWPAPRSRRC